MPYWLIPLLLTQLQLLLQQLALSPRPCPVHPAFVPPPAAAQPPVCGAAAAAVLCATAAWSAAACTGGHTKQSAAACRLLQLPPPASSPSSEHRPTRRPLCAHAIVASEPSTLQFANSCLPAEPLQACITLHRLKRPEFGLSAKKHLCDHMFVLHSHRSTVTNQLSSERY